MKNTYNAPEIKLIQLETEDVIATSGMGSQDDDLGVIPLDLL